MHFKIGNCWNGNVTKSTRNQLHRAKYRQNNANKDRYSVLFYNFVCAIVQCVVFMWPYSKAAVSNTVEGGEALQTARQMRHNSLLHHLLVLWGLMALFPRTLLPWILTPLSIQLFPRVGCWKEEPHTKTKLILKEDEYFIRQFDTRFFDGLCGDTKEDFTRIARCASAAKVDPLKHWTSFAECTENVVYLTNVQSLIL